MVIFLINRHEIEKMNCRRAPASNRATTPSSMRRRKTSPASFTGRRRMRKIGWTMPLRPISRKRNLRLVLIRCLRDQIGHRFSNVMRLKFPLHRQLQGPLQLKRTALMALTTRRTRHSDHQWRRVKKFCITLIERRLVSVHQQLFDLNGRFHHFDVNDVDLNHKYK